MDLLAQPDMHPTWVMLLLDQEPLCRMVRETREERRDRERRDILNARRNLEQRYDEDR